jgi:hypothetical protein
MAGHALIEAAIREGKFPESRRAHYEALMAKKPKKTAKLIAKLEPVLSMADEDADLVRQYVDESASRAAPAGSRATQGPTAYPKEWLGHGGGPRASVPAGGRGSITFENPVDQFSAGRPGDEL